MHFPTGYGLYNFDPSRITIPDTVQQINWSWFRQPGTHLCVAGTTGSGKTTLLILLARLLFGQEVIIVRDVGSFEFLDFANHGYRVRAFIPNGCVFAPDRRGVEIGNVEIIEFDPMDLEKTLFPRFVDDDALRTINLIEFDTFAEKNDALVIEFWKRLISSIYVWKEHRKRIPFALFMDEFTDISIQRKGGAKLYAEHDIASNITTRAIRNNFRKYRIRLVAAANPLKALDDTLRSQFTYFFLKEMTEGDLPSWAKPLAWMTERCRMDEVIILGGRPRRFNRYPLPPLATCKHCRFYRGMGKCELPGRDADHISPNSIACRKFQSAPKSPFVMWPVNHMIHVHVEASPYFMREMAGSKREEKMASRIALAIQTLNRRGIRCAECGKIHKVPFSEIARIFGWRAGTVAYEWLKRHPLKEGEDLEEPQRTSEATSEATSEEAPEEEPEAEAILK
ncbi:MAG: hypothetical protein QXG32_00620 [Candidatus Bathyarchaeia archaeon]